MLDWYRRLMTSDTPTPAIIEVHTSDRDLFKRCRRRFAWASTLRNNLIRIGPEQPAFFLGTGFHFGLEDWWGYRRFPHPALAFAAYYDAHRADDLPDEADDLLILATDMLSYYVEEWLEEHPEPYETLWVDGKPQVEIEVAISLNDILLEAAKGHQKVWLIPLIDKYSIEYVTTFDRVVIDKHGRIFGLDYKTATSFDELNLQTNPQAGAYDWAMDLFYTPVGYKPEGIIWQQFKKAVPKPPEYVNIGKKNEGFSLDVRQSTTYRLYRRALIEHYGTVPEKYYSFLAILGDAQDENGDRFIRQDVLRRNQTQREVEQAKIVQEVLEMLDPGLPLYPNPTKDCGWDCAFKAPCLANDDGSDFEHILRTEYAQWAGYKDDWRSKVKYPDAASGEPTDTLTFT
jgi:hypothetical protein